MILSTPFSLCIYNILRSHSPAFTYPPFKRMKKTVSFLTTLLFSSQGRGYWQKWSEDLANAASIPRDVAAHQILVPTVTTVQVTAILSLLVSQAKPLLLVGPPATGKSVYVAVRKFYSCVVALFSYDCHTYTVFGIRPVNVYGNFVCQF